VTRHIDGHKGRYGVEPICRVLEIAPSTFYAPASRPPCARQVRDEALKPEVARVHRDNYGVYGAHKVRRQLNREGSRSAATGPGGGCTDSSWQVSAGAR